MKKKVAIVFGTRPEAIKMAPVVLCLKEDFDVKVWVTAQHRDMLDQVLDLFDIKPDFDLDLMQPGQDLFDLSSRIFLGLKTVLSRENPDCILVHGDTTTSMISSLSAFYKKIPVFHVEAGLRTNDIFSPFPEEMNRKLTADLSSYHFSPTESAKSNLIKENIEGSKIFITGNTVVDALEYMKNEVITKNFSDSFLSQIPNFSKFENTQTKIILVTGHRRESFGEGFENICKALKKIATEFNEVQIIYPVHLNPNVLEPVNRILKGIDNIHLIKPLAYLDFIKLMDKSYLILTDSGGIQEEAPSFGKPVLLMRNNTERPEALEAGTVKLTGLIQDKIYSLTKQLITDGKVYNQMVSSKNPFGDGKASNRIKQVLKDVLING